MFAYPRYFFIEDCNLILELNSIFRSNNNDKKNDQSKYED